MARSRTKLAHPAVQADMRGGHTFVHHLAKLLTDQASDTAAIVIYKYALAHSDTSNGHAAKGRTGATHRGCIGFATDVEQPLPIDG